MIADFMVVRMLMLMIIIIDLLPLLVGCAGCILGAFVSQVSCVEIVQWKYISGHRIVKAVEEDQVL